jgi:hypothetical protein
MFDFNQFYGTMYSPMGFGIFASGLTIVYLILMAINVYLPPVLLLGGAIGYIIHYVQKHCGNCPNPYYQPYQPPPPYQPPTYPPRY